MKSLKITLLLAAFCLTFMGLTYSNNEKNADIQEIESFDIDNSEYQIAEDLKKAKKPPQA